MWSPLSRPAGRSPWKQYTVAVAAAIAIGGAGATAATGLNDVNWGDAPTWLATLFAGVAAVFAYRAASLEFGRERQSQASKIAVWPVDGDGLAEPHFALRNASDLPVYETMVYVFDEDFDLLMISVLEIELGVLAPRFDPDMWPTGAGAPTYRYRYGLAFRDSAGLEWYRTPAGVLAEGQPPADWRTTTSESRAY